MAPPPSPPPSTSPSPPPMPPPSPPPPMPSMPPPPPACDLDQFVIGNAPNHCGCDTANGFVWMQPTAVDTEATKSVEDGGCCVVDPEQVNQECPSMGQADKCCVKTMSPPPMPPPPPPPPSPPPPPPACDLGQFGIDDAPNHCGCDTANGFAWMQPTAGDTEATKSVEAGGCCVV